MEVEKVVMIYSSMMSIYSLEEAYKLVQERFYNICQRCLLKRNVKKFSILVPFIFLVKCRKRKMLARLLFMVCE